jgi:hypothetical protein
LLKKHMFFNFTFGMCVHRTSVGHPSIEAHSVTEALAHECKPKICNLTCE